MSFQDRIQIILPILQSKYVPYVTKSGMVPDIKDPERSDYDDIRKIGVRLDI